MLTSLFIRNYALIDEINADLQGGLNIITGETGAGKSILLGALSLILGNRADISSLRNQEEKCIVEGEFLIKDYHLQDIFSKHELDYDDIAVFRREITPSGKSRAFINDTPVNLHAMKSIGERLIDIHSQHQNLLISDSTFQLNVVDARAQNHQFLKAYEADYSNYRKLSRELAELQSQATKGQEEMDYLQFRFLELEKAKLKPGEEEALEEELEQLSHAGEIKSIFLEVSQSLDDEERGVLPSLKNLRNHLQKISGFHASAKEFEDRIYSAFLDLQDIAGEASNLEAETDVDPQRQEFVNERLSLFFDLKKKHGVDSVEQLISIRDRLDEELGNLTTFDARIENLTSALEKIRFDLSAKAKKLTESRKRSIPEIQEKVSETLKLMGIPNARFSISIKETDKFQPTGKDEVVFLFSANKQADLQDISKVASGGEVSRLMLTIKWLVSSSLSMPTIIFDEIDTGVSGEVAHKVGQIMQDMAKKCQVFSITHLPQVAGKGDHHYKVFKEDTDTATHTRLKKLSRDDRLTEIATMLSGDRLTDAAMENARHLLNI